MGHSRRPAGRRGSISPFQRPNGGLSVLPRAIRPDKAYRRTSLNLASTCIVGLLSSSAWMCAPFRRACAVVLLVPDDLLCPVPTMTAILTPSARSMHTHALVRTNAVSNEGEEEGRLELTLGELCKTLVTVCTSGTLCTTLPVRPSAPQSPAATWELARVPKCLRCSADAVRIALDFTCGARFRCSRTRRVRC
jgi:hypothetical protein